MFLSVRRINNVTVSGEDGSLVTLRDKCDWLWAQWRSVILTCISGKLARDKRSSLAAIATKKKKTVLFENFDDRKNETKSSSDQNVEKNDENDDDEELKRRADRSSESTCPKRPRLLPRPPPKPVTTTITPGAWHCSKFRGFYAGFTRAVVRCLIFRRGRKISTGI